ncbi:MAG: hypothetical protein JO269_03345 [Burkholderiaceae bacterium]|nr:hypothetical protein [Burkholderiaceae bacterium]
MTIKLKLRILMLVTLLAIAGGIVATAIGFNSVNNTHADAHRRQEQVRGITEIKASLLATMGLDPATEDTKRIFAEAERDIAKWAEVTAPLFLMPARHQAFQNIVGAWSEYDQKSQQLITLAATDPKQANDKNTELYRSNFQPMMAMVEQLADECSKEAAASIERANNMSTFAVRAVVAILAVILLLVVGGVLVVSASIRKALGGEPEFAAKLCQRIADGDLTTEIVLQDGDKHSLLAAMHDMKDKLTVIVHGIKQASGTIAVGASEIAVGNTDLAQRTEEQAASLEETATSMEQLASAVGNNADNAKQAESLADSALDVAHRGGEVVKRVVVTMDQISESSAKIGEIVKLIESIAFQTNILALNAAVEAARAGEQGRGFAVVASEVRNLAQRCAGATTEIKSLIEESVSRVGNGGKLVAEAGSTIEEIVHSVMRVNDIVREISSASSEQHDGITQVNKAVTQMDDVTQQNAALVEEASAAAQSMSHQADMLRDAVAVFRMKEAGQQRVQAMAPAAGAAAASGGLAVVKSTSRALPDNPARNPRLPARKVVGGESEWESF